MFKVFLTLQHQSEESRFEVGGAQQATSADILTNLQVKLEPENKQLLF